MELSRFQLVRLVQLDVKPRKLFGLDEKAGYCPATDWS